MNYETQTSIIAEATATFRHDLARTLSADTTIAARYLHTASSGLANIAPMLTDDELDAFSAQFVERFQLVWSRTWRQIELRDELITMLRLHRARMACEQLRRDAEERDYVTTWRNGYDEFDRLYNLLMERDGWTQEWAQLSTRAIRYRNILVARHDDYIEFGRLHI